MRRYDEMRRSITRTVEGYDAADPRRVSTLALRDEWMARDDGPHGRIAKGYGALIEYLLSDCRRHGATLQLGAAVAAIDETRGRDCRALSDGATFEADAAVLTVPVPLLSEIALPSAARQRVAAAADIGFGNVVKILFRFATQVVGQSWRAGSGRFVVPAFPTHRSRPGGPSIRTEYPVLTGWLAGPKADRVSSLAETELVAMGLASLGEIFDLSPDQIRSDLVAARAINWGNDPFARGAYSYATPGTREAQSVLKTPDEDAIFFSGEALYAGPEMGTVEAALASGQETARVIVTGSPATPARVR